MEKPGQNCPPPPALSPGEAGLKLNNFFLVYCIDPFADVATATIIVAADSSQSLLVSTSVAEGACHKQVDAIFFFVCNYLLSNAIIDSAHELFLRHDETPAAHIPDDAEVPAV